MKKCLVMFLFFLFSLFVSLVLGGMDEKRMDSDKNKLVVTSYPIATQASQE